MQRVNALAPLFLVRSTLVFGDLLRRTPANIFISFYGLLSGQNPCELEDLAIVCLAIVGAESIASNIALFFNFQSLILRQVGNEVPSYKRLFIAIWNYYYEQ